MYISLEKKQVDELTYLLVFVVENWNRDIQKYFLKT
jgi:hypothetical protein